MAKSSYREGRCLLGENVWRSTQGKKGEKEWSAELDWTTFGFTGEVGWGFGHFLEWNYWLDDLVG